MFFKKKATIPRPAAPAESVEQGPTVTAPKPANPRSAMYSHGGESKGFSGAWSKIGGTARLLLTVGGFALVTVLTGMLMMPAEPGPPKPQTGQATETNVILPNRRDAAQGGITGLANRVDDLQRQQEGILEGIKAIKDTQTQQGLNGGGSQPFMAEEMAAQINALKEEVSRLKTQSPMPPGATPPKLDTQIGLPTGQPPKAEPAEPPPPPKMRIVGEPTKSFNASADEQLAAEVETLLAGGTFEGVLLNGMDAPTSVVTEKNPVPVLIRVKTDAILPNLYQAGVRECFVIAAGYGVLATERAQLRTETISCVRPDGKPMEMKLDAYVVGEDGKVGMRGRLVSKQGQVIAQSLAAGFLEGIARGAVPQQVPQLNINPGGTPQTQTPDFSNVMRNGALGGVGTAASQISKFYLDMAQQMFPVVEIDAGRRVSIVTLKGMNLSGHSLK